MNILPKELINNKEYITSAQAKADLGNDAYFALHRWLREKEYRNLDPIFITKQQLQEFIQEQIRSFKGSDNIVEAWGQTTEHWRGKTKK